ncbi:unnamed protein product [Dicrocoelium dendriticum]|nr:unnamed protein product [Dicrocoelium dendriticum]
MYALISAAIFPFASFRLIPGSPSEAQVVMQNDAGDFVDLYIPRRCAVTNRLIGVKDHASIQLRFVELDSITGRMTNGIKSYDIAGAVRRMGESDECINRLAVRDGLLPRNFCDRS